MPYRCAPDVTKPSEQLFSLLMGKTTWGDSPDSIRSWATKHIYDAAAEILKMDGKPARQKALGKIPGAMRSMVEDEIMRLWNLRKPQGSNPRATPARAKEEE